MKKFLVACAVAASLCLASFSAKADEDPPKLKHVGAQLDLGVPDGAALGVVVRPYWYWLKVGASGTYNGIAPGIRGGLQLDPIKFGIRLTLNGEVGHSFEGSPGSLVGKDLPSLSYTYANLHGGLEMGNWNGFSFFLHAGPTWMDVQTSNFSSVLKNSNGLTVSDPHGTATLLPTFKLGFSWLFI